MKLASIIFLSIVGFYATMEGFLALAMATSAMHKIYGGTMITCAEVCAGFLGVLSSIGGEK